ncbi:hypothetical protein GCM10009827_059670 [Dactylosporangium maewongense]|uniref:Uncharacterized protein n=1 Tax=Dactylosporangium maewongense TaxID=634393 RepID=A0ABP4LZF5_9ACTN
MTNVVALRSVSPVVFTPSPPLRSGAGLNQTCAHDVQPSATLRPAHAVTTTALRAAHVTGTSPATMPLKVTPNVIPVTIVVARRVAGGGWRTSW